jgi:hypothetical protein
VEHALGEARGTDLPELPRLHLDRPHHVVLGRRAVSRTPRNTRSGGWLRLFRGTQRTDRLCERRIGIADLVNIFNPDLVVIGGAFIQAKEILHSIIEKTILSNVLQPSSQNLRIEFAERNTEACVLGAVAIVLDDILREMVIS